MTLNELRVLFAYIALYSIIIPILISIYKWKNISKELKIISISLIFGFLLFLLSISLYKLDIENNLFISYFIISKNALFHAFFYYLVIKNVVIKKSIIALSSILTFFVVLDAFVITGYDKLANLSSVPITVFLVFLSLFYLYLYFKEDKTKIEISNSYFWISLGLFIDSFFSFFNELFSNDLIKYSYDVYFQFAIFGYIIGIIANILYSIAFWNGKKSKIY